MSATRISETILFHGFASIRGSPCACGGFIVVGLGDPTSEISAHQRSELHQLWRSWMTLLDEMPGPDVPVVRSPGQMGAEL